MLHIFNSCSFFPCMLLPLLRSVKLSLDILNFTHKILKSSFCNFILCVLIVVYSHTMANNFVWWACHEMTISARRNVVGSPNIKNVLLMFTAKDKSRYLCWKFRHYPCDTFHHSKSWFVFSLNINNMSILLMCKKRKAFLVVFLFHIII